MPTPYNDFDSQHPVVGTKATGINDIDALSSKVQWAPGAGGVTSLTFSFPWSTNGTATWATDYVMGEPSSGSALTPVQQDAVRKLLGQFSSITNIKFTEVTETTTNVGDLRFGLTNATHLYEYTTPAWAALPNETVSSGGDVWLTKKAFANSSLAVGTWEFYAVMHEIGHALGLKHSFDKGEIGFGNTIDAANENHGQTMMSYTDGSVSVLKFTRWPTPAKGLIEIDNPSTPMILDIVALQHMYGANMTHRTGDDLYQYTGSQDTAQTIWDAGGNDTLSFDGYIGQALMDLEPGKFSIALHEYHRSICSYIGIAKNCIIENAIGSLGHDSIVGNSADNRLDGGSGDDTVIGGIGNDTVIGSEGNDVLFGNLGNDTFDGGEGNDTLTGGAGDDVLIDGKGKDTAVYAHAKSAYVITAASMLEIKVASTQEGVDTLKGIERLEFSDVKLAFDLDGSAGHAALLMGCVAGKASLQNKALVGNALAWIPDNSSLADVSQSLVNEGIVATVAGGADNTSLVKLLMRNVLGSDSDVALVNSLTSLIDTGAYSQASMLTAASQLDANKIQVDLIGLSQTGLEYI